MVRGPVGDGRLRRSPKIVAAGWPATSTTTVCLQRHVTELPCRRGGRLVATDGRLLRRARGGHLSNCCSSGREDTQPRVGRNGSCAGSSGSDACKATDAPASYEHRGGDLATERPRETSPGLATVLRSSGPSES